MNWKQKGKKIFKRYPGLDSGSKKKGVDKESMDIQIKRVNEAFHLVMDVRLSLQGNSLPLEELAIDAAWLLVSLEDKLKELKKSVL